MDARIEAAERILDRGVRFKLPASIFSRLLKRDRVDIRPLRGGTILEFAIVVVENRLDEALEKEDWQFLQQAIKPVARCVAIAILNSKEGIEKETDELADKLLWQIPAGKLIEIFRVIAVQNRLSDFMSITRFFCRQTMMMMNPKNLGQEE
jgi:hypothetical protein